MNSPNAIRRRASGIRFGQTMLELVAASMVISIALIPALKFTRSSLRNMERLEQQEFITLLSVSKLEESLALTAGSWDLTSLSGDFSSSGHPNIHYQVSRSDSVTEGGTPGKLAVLRVTVWQDEDGGGDVDADEPQSTISTKLAKVLSSEYEATIH